MPANPSDIPAPSVRRLSLYLRQLDSLLARQTPTVSSRNLAESLGLTDAQVRKDLAHFGQFGRPGVGYEVRPLIQTIRAILGTDRVTPTLLIGVGNLGRAISAYQGFASKGFNLVAIVDADPKKIGRKVGQLTIEPLDDLEQIVRKRGVRLAIIAVPAEAAPAVLERLTLTEIRGVLNFAPIALKPPPGLALHNLDVAAELEQLLFLTRST